jgi:hypothetical protein
MPVWRGSPPGPFTAEASGTLRSFTNLIAIVCVLHRRGVPVIAGAD